MQKRVFEKIAYFVREAVSVFQQTHKGAASYHVQFSQDWLMVSRENLIPVLAINRKEVEEGSGTCEVEIVAADYAELSNLRPLLESIVAKLKVFEVLPEALFSRAALEACLERWNNLGNLYEIFLDLGINPLCMTFQMLNDKSLTYYGTWVGGAFVEDNSTSVIGVREGESGNSPYLMHLFTKKGDSTRTCTSGIVIPNKVLDVEDEVIYFCNKWAEEQGL